jgi:translocation and assembly module TamB
MQVGQVTVRDAGVSFTDLPNGLSNINGTLVFNENRLQVQTLAANTGGGALNIGGFISYQNGIYFDLTARGKDVRLRYPPGLSAAADADLRYSGTPKASLLSGDILVTRFGVNPRFDFALYLATTKNAPTGPSANSLLDNMRIDVHVTSTPELRVETELAKIAGDADLRFRGTLARPTVLGRVNIAEGDIFFNSTKYRLERGDISFNNPVRIEPVLNVEASARVREYDITLGFHGSVDKLSTTYRSEPPLPTADIIALLALGRTREDAVLNNQPIQQNFAETASSAILGQALDAAVSSRVQKLFGVSRIKIDPQVGGPETATGARVTIEQQVNNNVTLTYITNLARANQQIIQGEFNFSRDLSLVVVRDENGVLGFDIKIRHRKK